MTPARFFVRACAAAALATVAGTVTAAGGPLGIDHELGHDESGIWSRNDQLALAYGVVAFEIGGAMLLGNDDEFGHVLWQTIDASSVSALGATGLKLVFGRARPYANQGPNAWFKGTGNQSFPSGEVTLQASFVTPIIAHYADRHPAVWALEILPVYDGLARMKSQAHWQTDVLAGWCLGTVAGYWAASRPTPLSVQVLPHGFSVGYSTKF